MTRNKFVGVVFIALIGLSSIAYFFADDGFFIGNIIPEIIGVCVELLIIVFVLDAWNKKEEKDKKIKVERRLREFMIFFLKHNFKDFPLDCQPGDFYGKDHNENQNSLNNLISHIDENGLNESIVLKVQSYCENEKEIFNNLIPVASDLTNDHFKSWVRLAYFMNAIVSKNEKTSYAVIKILQNIKRFDNESFEHGLYVGSK